MDDSAIAEDIYLELYGYLADKAEYLQPGGDKQLLLPEAMAAAFVASLLAPFLKGFFETLGKEAATKIVERIRGETRNAKPDTDALVGSLGENLVTIRGAMEKLPKAQEVIYYELKEMGLSDGNSELLARRSVQIIRKHVEQHASRA